MAKVLAQVPYDLISMLPDNVIDAIMMYLPIQDAVRTSILSSKWRYRWAKLPELVLDGTLWNKLTVKHSAAITVTMVLYQLLLLHEGPIYKFTLSIPGLEICPEIDSMIIFLLRKGIEDLTLNMPITDSYRLPLSFLTCQHLKHLSLQRGSIKNTFSFKGYNRLITLKLWYVTISNEVLESLISSSPFLEVLELELISDFYGLEIDAPNLKSFSFEGHMKSISFRKAPLLASVLVKPEDVNQEVVTRNLVDFFHSLPVLEQLYLNFNLVMSLVAGGVPRRLSTTLLYLKDLVLSDITLDALDELSFVLCLMRNSPNLKCVDIYIYGDPADDTADVLKIIKEEDQTDVMLNELKKVNLRNITGNIVELEFIKLLLSKSPSLEKMLIQPGMEIADKELQILRKLTKFRRASTEAEVVYEEMEKDQV